jgi:hypothetical protein
MQNPQLQTDGKFDKKKYLDALKNDIQFYAIPGKLHAQLSPPQEVAGQNKERSGITMDSLKVEYNKEMNVVVEKPCGSISTRPTAVYVSDAEVKAYYDKNKETEYKKGPPSRIKYWFLISNLPMPIYNLVKTDIDMVYNQAHQRR